MARSGAEALDRTEQEATGRLDMTRAASGAVMGALGAARWPGCC